MGKEIVFKDWKELQSYLQEITSEVWEAMERDGFTYEDSFDFVLRRLRDKPKEDFGNDVQATA